MLSTKIVAALTKLSDEHPFYAGDEGELISILIADIGMPDNRVSYSLLREHLFSDAIQPALKKAGIEFTATDMD